jgi:hypothetical protein
MRLLAEKLDATPDELAAWIFLGPDSGGIAAYLNANELPDPPRFHFDHFMGEDYLAPMMACWFRQSEIDSFAPEDRYITGEKLIERWGELPDIRAEPFIRAKIAEDRLINLHPTFGGTVGTFSDADGFPSLAAGLFPLSQIEAIEVEDFDISAPPVTEQDSPCPPVEAWQIRQRFRVVRNEDQNDEWWKEKMANAERYGLLDCRAGEGKKGRGSGSLWKPAMIAGWLVDRQEKGKEGMAAAEAGNALRQFPGCEDLAETMFPPNDSSL